MAFTLKATHISKYFLFVVVLY